MIITSELKQLRIQLHVYPDQLKAAIKDLSNFLKKELEGSFTFFSASSLALMSFTCGEIRWHIALE